jgi:hypothetical protein
VLLVSVILIGAFVIGPATSEMQAGAGDAETLLIAAAAWDVLALACDRAERLQASNVQRGVAT